MLVDAPCCGSGTWRRQPELKWRLTPERLMPACRLQDELLDHAPPHLGPGGRLVYATCSLLPCENEDRIAAFLARNPGFAAIRWRRSGANAGHRPPPGMGEFFRASPRATGTDGFFTAVLERLAQGVLL